MFFTSFLIDDFSQLSFLMIDNTSYSNHEPNDGEYVEIDYNSILSDDEENQNCSSDNEAIPKTDMQFEKNCFYCRKTFTDKTLYDTHYSQCYDTGCIILKWS